MDGQVISLSYKEVFGKAAHCSHTWLYLRRVEVVGKLLELVLA